MENTLRAIIAEASKTKPEYGEYKNHGDDSSTQGINVSTSTGYTLGVSRELIKSYEEGSLDEDWIKRIKIKRSPQ